MRCYLITSIIIYEITSTRNVGKTLLTYIVRSQHKSFDVAFYMLFYTWCLRYIFSRKGTPRRSQNKCTLRDVANNLFRQTSSKTILFHPKLSIYCAFLKSRKIIFNIFLLFKKVTPNSLQCNSRFTPILLQIYTNAIPGSL